MARTVSMTRRHFVPLLFGVALVFASAISPTPISRAAPPAKGVPAAPGLAQWLTRSVFIGTGEGNPPDVVIRFWRVE